MTPVSFLDASGWAPGAVLALHWISVGAAASLPWLAAHLEWRGWKHDSVVDREAAARLGDAAVSNVGSVFLFGAAALLLASAQDPAAFFTAAVLLASALFALLALAAGYIALLYLHRHGWGGGRPLLRAAAAAGAGLLAAPAVAVLAAVSLAASDPALWPRLGSDPWMIFSQRGLLLRAAHLYLAAFATGGVALMLVGRRAFRWESAIPLSGGARLIKRGALVALLALLLAIGLDGAWLFLNGLGIAREMVAEGGPPMLFALAVVAGGGVLLLEILVSAIRWRGSAPRASAAAALLLLVVALGAGSARSLMGRPQPGAPGPSASSGPLEGGRR